MIKVSIIIPVYNVEKYLEECLESVLSQRLADIEIICIDDGSTDCSGDILWSYAQEYTNVKVIKQKNQGSGAARNRGLKEAKGKYICFMDPDDYYPNECVLEKMYQTMEEKKLILCGGECLALKNNKLVKFLEYGKSELRFTSNELEMFNFCTFMYSKELLDGHNIQFPLYRRFQDPPFLVNVMLCARQYWVMNETVYVYRIDYKKASLNSDIMLGILSGYKDILEMCIAYDNKCFYYEKWYKYYLLQRENFFKYLFKKDDRIWEKVNEINGLLEGWIGKNAEGVITASMVREWRTAIVRLLDFVKTNNHVLIYGAGIVGQYIMNVILKNNLNFELFVVSGTNNSDKINGLYEVKSINEFMDKKDEVSIVVAVGQNSKKEVIDNLHDKGFSKIFVADYQLVKFLNENEDMYE